MKLQYYILIILYIVSQTIYINAQTVTLYTPKGQAYEGETFAELSSDEIVSLTEAYRKSYPEATIIAPASRTYNCHSYAWHLTCSGIPICWINNFGNNLSKQWEYGSYVETTSALAEKVYYYNGDHSAVTIEGSGAYISKWGQAPLMKHRPDYGPSGYNMTARKYYKRVIPTNPIHGSTLIGNSVKTLSFSNDMGSPHYVKWTCSTNLEIKSSTTTSVTIVSTNNGKAWVQADVHGYTIKYDVWSGTPVPNISGPTNTPNGQYARWKAECDYLASPTAFEWILNPVNGNSIYGTNSEFLDVAFYNTGNYQVIVRATNANGVGEYTVKSVTVYNPAKNYTFQVYPNPASNVLNISLQIKVNQTISTKETLTNGQTYRIYLYNGFGANVKQTTIKGQYGELDVSNLPNGFYYLHIYEKNNEKPEIHKVIINH